MAKQKKTTTTKKAKQETTAPKVNPVLLPASAPGSFWNTPKGKQQIARLKAYNAQRREATKATSTLTPHQIQEIFARVPKNIPIRVSITVIQQGA